MMEKLKGWWKSTWGSHRVAVLVVAVVVGTPGRLQRGLLRGGVLPRFLPGVPLHGSLCRPVAGVQPRERDVHQVPLLLPRLHHGDHPQVLDGTLQPAAACRREGRRVPGERMPRGADQEGEGEDGGHHLRPPGAHDEAEARREAALHELPLRDRPGGEHRQGLPHPGGRPRLLPVPLQGDRPGTGPGRLPGVPWNAHENRGARRLHVLARIVPEDRRAVHAVPRPGGRGQREGGRCPLLRLPCGEAGEEERRAGHPPHPRHLQRDPMLQMPREDQPRGGRAHQDLRSPVRCVPQETARLPEGNVHGHGGQGGSRHAVADVLRAGVVQRMPHQVHRGERVRRVVPGGKQADGGAAKLRGVPREAVRPDAGRLGPGVPQPGRRPGTDRGIRKGGRRERVFFQPETRRRAGARGGCPGEPEFPQGRPGGAQYRIRPEDRAGGVRAGDRRVQDGGGPGGSAPAGHPRLPVGVLRHSCATPA